VWSLRFQQGFCLPDNADRDCSELGVPDAADRVLHSPRKTEPEGLTGEEYGSSTETYVLFADPGGANSSSTSSSLLRNASISRMKS